MSSLIPETEEQWHHLVWLAGVENKKPLILDLKKSAYGLEDKWNEAGIYLESSEEFSKYLRAIKAGIEMSNLNEDNVIWPGSFKMARRYQERVIESYQDIVNEARGSLRGETPSTTAPSRQSHHSLRHRASRIFRGTFGRQTLRRHRSQPYSTTASQATTGGPISHTTTGGPAPHASHESGDRPSFPAIQDPSITKKVGEEVANIALVLFLEALADLLPASKSEWVPNRVLFTSKFRGGQSEARTDGCLWTREGRNVQAIIEVKPRCRAQARAALLRQESGEMVGWILSNSEKLPDLHGR
ncbi:hypothetical protein M432DRAFT_593980 [Thermoascus aurantiacus ATCC 26904]